MSVSMIISLALVYPLYREAASLAVLSENVQASIESVRRPGARKIGVRGVHEKESIFFFPPYLTTKQNLGLHRTFFAET